MVENSLNSESTSCREGLTVFWYVNGESEITIDSILETEALPIDKFFFIASEYDFSDPSKKPMHKNTETNPTRQETKVKMFLPRFFFRFLNKKSFIQEEEYESFRFMNVSLNLSFSTLNPSLIKPS